jgi:hypothetical protein
MSVWLPFNENFAIFQLSDNHIGGVMVSVLASSVINHVFHPQSGQTKDYKNGICCFNELDFYSASSLKEQYADRHVAPLWHIILIPSQSIFALSA